MSVINQMLKDLDARAGKEGGGDVLAAVRPVTAAPVGRWRRPVLILLMGILAAMAAMALWLARTPARPVTVAAAPVPTMPAPKVKTIVLAPSPAAPVAAEAPAPIPIEAPVLEVPKVPVSAAPAPPAPRAVPPTPAPTAPNRIDSPYRRALALLAEGRRDDAVAALELLLRTDAKNGAARETLVGLLIEGGRAEQAMQQLQAGLAADPRQGAMAMLLARMQIERGGDGIDTLLRSLPFVDTGEADAQATASYHAFLAGALQRRQRHREAVEQYQAALKSAPTNGVWLMGLGISLRAEGRAADSVEAFTRARAGGTLSPELDAYVERQLQKP
ncbi:MAG: tetratricopeptide repeat protein [Massilia sp.]